MRFWTAADRIAHDVWLAAGQDWVQILASVEGSPRDDWPASPPFQSLDFAARGQRHAALLVGMAGKSHWSASIELDPATDRVTFDVACRIRAGSVGSLASRYRWLQPPCAQGDEQAIFAASAAPRVRARLAVCRDLENACLRWTADSVAVVAAKTLENTESKTIRWRYTIERMKEEG